MLEENCPELRRKLNIRLDAKVAGDLEGGNWRLPYKRVWDQVINFYDNCRGIHLSQGADYCKWLPTPKFSVKSATLTNIQCFHLLTGLMLTGVIIIFLDIESSFGLHFKRG